MALKEASGKYLILTDGDVYFEKGAVGLLLESLKKPQVAAVTGRPVSQDNKDNFMGYLGHLLADAAHHKRMVTMVIFTPLTIILFIIKAEVLGL